MASETTTWADKNLEEFLRWPRIDEKPYLEYVRGRIVTKAGFETWHGMILMGIANCLNRFSEPSRLGLALPRLRCTFAGMSLVTDVAFLRSEHIVVDQRGRMLNEDGITPDIHIEIHSTENSLDKTRTNLALSVNHGCPVGWLIDPYQRSVDIFRPGQEVIRLPADGSLDGSPVLPDFRVTLSEIFGWVVLLQSPNQEPGENLP